MHVWLCVYIHVCGWLCVCMCGVYACVVVCMGVCLCVCVHACAHVHCLYMCQGVELVYTTSNFLPPFISLDLCN